MKRVTVAILAALAFTSCGVGVDEDITTASSGQELTSSDGTAKSAPVQGGETPAPSGDPGPTTLPQDPVPLMPRVRPAGPVPPPGEPRPVLF